jgi:predicted AAA+ superfamily ATPase
VVLSKIAEEIQVSPKTLKKWLEVLERMYIVFVVKPYTKKISRAIQKPPKVFFFDNADVLGDDGARFENLVATHLIKKIHFLEDRDGYKYELAYIRDKEKREVDFVILKEGKISELIEAKFNDDQISTSLKYYTERLKPERAMQVVYSLKRSYQQDKICVLNPIEALSDLG